MVGAGNIAHVDDVDREAVQVVGRLEDAAVADAAAFAVAQPAFGDAGFAGLLQTGVGGAADAVFGVEPGVERGVERAAGELRGEAGDLGRAGSRDGMRGGFQGSCVRLAAGRR